MGALCDVPVEPNQYLKDTHPEVASEIEDKSYNTEDLERLVLKVYKDIREIVGKRGWKMPEEGNSDGVYAQVERLDNEISRGITRRNTATLGYLLTFSPFALAHAAYRVAGKLVETAKRMPSEGKIRDRIDAIRILDEAIKQSDSYSNAN